MPCLWVGASASTGWGECRLERDAKEVTLMVCFCFGVDGLLCLCFILYMVNNSNAAYVYTVVYVYAYVLAF